MDANGIAVLSFGAIFGVASLLAPASAGATPIHASVTAAAPAGFTPGLKAIHVNPIGGKCKTGFVKEIVPRTQRLTFQRVNGTKFTKLVKKGAVVCTYKNAAGKVTLGTFSADGTLTALPPGFPKNPTIDDIARLGLTVNSKVGPNVVGKINGPKASDCIPIKLVQTISPEVVSWDAATGIAVVDWTLTGGQGLVTLSYTAPETRENLFGDTYVELSPSAPTVIRESAMYDPTAAHSRFSIDLTSNCGQDNVPRQAMGSGWDVIERTTDYGRWAVNAQSNVMRSDDSTFSITADGKLIRK